jgi:hypothetical protein
LPQHLVHKHLALVTNASRQDSCPHLHSPYVLAVCPVSFTFRDLKVVGRNSAVPRAHHVCTYQVRLRILWRLLRWCSADARIMFRCDCAGSSFCFRHGKKETSRSFATQHAPSFRARLEARENEPFRNTFAARQATIATGTSLRIRKRWYTAQILLCTAA